MTDHKQPMDARQLPGDPAKWKELLSSPEVRQLAALLDAGSGGGLQSAAQSAKQGDTTRLEQLMRGLSATEEGARLLAQLQRKLSK